MSRKLETLESIKYFNWLKANSAIFPILKMVIHIPNEGKRSKAYGASLLAMGMLPGAPDYVLLTAGQIPGYDGILQPFAIEMKTLKGKQSPEQKKFQECYQALGGKYYLCRTAQEAVRITKQHLKDIWTIPPHN